MTHNDIHELTPAARGRTPVYLDDHRNLHLRQQGQSFGIRQGIPSGLYAAIVLVRTVAYQP